jgi:hypothetical protein
MDGAPVVDEEEEEEDGSLALPSAWVWPVDDGWDGGRMVNDTGVFIVEVMMTLDHHCSDATGGCSN